MAHSRKPLARLDWTGRSEGSVQPIDPSLWAEVYPEGIGGDASPLDRRLILGENLAVMTALAETWEGKIDLIYADPPFLSGNAYRARVGRGEDSRRPSQWRTARGYNDAWEDGAAYLNMLFPRLRLMHRLLSPTGTLYLHLDWHAAAYARILLDEIFGGDRLLNEIVWVYHGPSPIRSAFKRKHDTILVYTKSSRYTFNADEVRVPYDPATRKAFQSSNKAGFGKVPDLERGKVPEDWWYFPVVARLHKERTGYPTQKPEALLERIILASSNPGDMVADFFCGSGTTAVVAGRCGRRWILCDHAPLAVHTTHRRLLLQPDGQPFTLWVAGPGPKARLRPMFTARIQGPRVALELTDLKGSQEESPSFPENLTLWEVDWDYDGRLFRSRSQAARELRSGDVPLRLQHTYPHPGRHTICVRAADSLGHLGQASRALTTMG